MGAPLLELIQRLDAMSSGRNLTRPRPTTFSIARIEQHFSIKLPASFLEFIRYGRRSASWFASFGADYQSPEHVIRINSYWRRRRRTRAIPRNLVAFTLGFDDDLDCFDLNRYDAASGEYGICYWSPGVEGCATYADFPDYIKRQVSAWEKMRKTRDA